MPPTKTERLDSRNGKIWRAYVAGHTEDTIAERHGITQQRVSQIIAEIRASIPEIDRDAIRTRHLEALDLLHAEMVELAVADAPPTFQQGKPLVDPATGDVVRDVTARLAAADRVVKLQERIARLVDLDAPSRSKIEVELPEQVATLLQRSRTQREAGGAA